MSCLVKLFIISALVGGIGVWFMFTSQIPEGLEQRDDLSWFYHTAKIGRMVSSFVEVLGVSHRAVLFRKMEDMMVDRENVEDEDGIKTYNTTFDGVDVVVVQSLNKEAYGPALVWIHGGGYRLAPEFPYPVPLNDCFTATVHFMKNAISFDVDPFRIAIGGFSSGGNLAAALNLKIRDSNLVWKNKVQILISPALQVYNLETPSYLDNQHDDFLPKYAGVNFWLWYAVGSEGHLLTEDFVDGKHKAIIDPTKKYAPLVDWKSLGIAPSTTTAVKSSKKKEPASSTFSSAVLNIKSILLDPLFSPLMSTDLSGLPATFVATAEFDVLRDEGLMYAERLKRQDVDVTSVNYKGAFHHLLFWELQHYNLSRRVLDDVVQFLKAKL